MIVLAESSKMSLNQQARSMGQAWERLPHPRPAMTLEICSASGKMHIFYLGPPSPQLTPKELELLHTLWLELSHRLEREDLRHADVVYFALKELERGLAQDDKVAQRLREYMMERENQRKTG
jgi:hypothetical protein